MNRKHFPDLPDERVLVVVPTYNEIDNIEALCERVLTANTDVDLLIVDDDSPDGTGKLARQLAADEGRLGVLHRDEKAGLGPAYVAGFDWGLTAGYDVLVELDADGSHQPEQLPRLLAALERADVAIGSRYVPGGAVVNWPKHRELISRGGNFYARHALDLPIRDPTSGFRAFRRTVLDAIDYPSAVSQGYSFQLELAMRAIDCGFKVIEVPITFVERHHGESKMDGPIVREAVVRVASWGIQRRIGRWRGDAHSMTTSR